LLCGCHRTTASGDIPASKDAGAEALNVGAGDAATLETGQGTADPMVVLPLVINVPFVAAGAGEKTTTFAVSLRGHGPVAGIVWHLEGSARLHLSGVTPDTIAEGQAGEITIQYDGSPTEEIEGALLTASAQGTIASSRVWAVAGHPEIGSAVWQPVAGAGGVACGEGTTVLLPAAPFPHEGTPWSAHEVRVYLPEGYRDLDAQDMVVHFHGFADTLRETLATHLYQEQLCASGANSILVVPQGPVDAASGDFGKLMHPDGLQAMLRQVLVMTYRSGRVQHPKIGDVVLTSHSGGYRAVAANLDIPGLEVREAILFDSLYGLEDRYEQFVVSGGRLISDYTPGGGTVAGNHALAKTLSDKGIKVASNAWQRSLRDAPAVMALADTTHEGSTRLDGIYADALRFSLRHHCRGPRIELRQATIQAGTASVHWLSPVDVDLEEFVVETSQDGITWVARARVSPEATQASFPFSGGARVRVLPVVKGIDPNDALPSDTARIDADAKVLIVDGFDRVVGGAFGGLHHDFAARVGEAVGGSMMVSHRALVEDGFDPAPWPVMMWLMGDESGTELTFSHEERELVTSYVRKGGRIVVSGSNVAWDLHTAEGGPTFLSGVLGARLDLDNADSNQASGFGALISIREFVFGRAGAPYEEHNPDSLAPVAGAQVVLAYDNGKPAAVGFSGRSVLVGFPLEVVEATRLAEVAKGLVSFVQ
jgi:hypothetical protein